MSQALPLDEAVRALKLDPTQPVVARVDDLTVEIRMAPPANESDISGAERSAADLLRDLGPWEGESDAEFADLWRSVRQQANRVVPDLEKSTRPGQRTARTQISKRRWRELTGSAGSFSARRRN